MCDMLTQEMAQWFDHYLPDIKPGFGEGSPCWISRMKTRTAEHNPPFYWLGRALDIMYANGEESTVRARLHGLHGAQACNGDGRDELLQRVLSEACAYAWTATHLGVPRVEVTREGDSIATDPIRFVIGDREVGDEVYVMLARLRARSSTAEVVADVAEVTRMTVDRLPAARGRLMYLDMWYERGYPATVGYDLELTEPVQAALRHDCDDAQLGYVFTRPFQWGNPVSAHY